MATGATALAALDVPVIQARLRDDVARGAGRSRDCGPDAARRRDAGRDPRVRRAHRRRRRSRSRSATPSDSPVGRRAALRARPRALRAASPASRSATPGCAARRRRAARVAIVLSSFPTKHARLGNAVGLDTPASAIALLDALRDDGHRVEHDFADGDALMHALIAAGGHDPEFLTDDAARGRAAAAAGRRLPARGSRRCPPTLREAIEETLGPAAGRALRRRRRLRVRRPRPRQRASSPSSRRAATARTRSAIYHDPDLPPAHHYLACYRWLDAAGAPTRSSTSASTARWSGCRARRSALSARLRARRRARRRCRSSTRSSSTTPARARRPSAAPTPCHRPPRAADDAGRDLRRAGPARAAARRVRPLRGARPGQAARRSRRASGRLLDEADLHRDLDVDDEQPAPTTSAR